MAKKKFYLLWFVGIPEQRNRALYQRALYLAKNTDLSIFSFKGVQIATEIVDNAKVIYSPMRQLNRLKILSNILAKAYISCYVIYKLFFMKDIIIYTFQRNGFTAGGILKLIKPKNLKWIVDMQHTPFYYYEASAKEGLFLVKRIIFRILGYLYFILGKYFLKKADLVFAMSFEYNEGFAKILLDNFNLERKKLYPIPNGVDLKLITKAKEYTIKHRTNIRPSKIRFLYAGNIWPERLTMLKEILDNIQKQKKANLLLCGNMSIDTRAIYPSLKDQNITYFGLIPHSNLLELYNNVDVILVIIDKAMRDHRYSHPGKLFEALAMGKLVVVSDIEVSKRIIEDGHNGLIIHEDNIPDICQKLIKVLNNPRLKSKIEANAAQSIKFLDWAKLNKKWFERINMRLLQGLNYSK